jgi:hypothetical protein
MLYEHINELEEKMNNIVDDITEEVSDLNDESISKEDNILNNLNYFSIPDIRIIQIPKCKMVSSGYGFFGDDNFNKFDEWFSKLSNNGDYTWEIPKDFAWYDPEKEAMIWWYVKPGDDIDTLNFEIVDFEGGLYVTAVSRDGDDEDGNRVYTGIKKWIEKSDILELDERPGHYTMYHVITPSSIKEELGFQQLEILVPVKKRKI